MRRLVANLDAESELASRTPSMPALDAAAAMGTLLRAFTRNGDRLHLAASLNPERLADVPGLPRPALESGPLADLDPPSEVLAWCETPAVAAHRSGPAARAPAGNLREPLHEVLWRLPPPSPKVVARVHHRGFHLQISRKCGLALPGATLVKELDALQHHLEDGGIDASPSRRFVVKAPFSAAGRGRWVGSPAELSSSKARRTVENLFRGYGTLLFEPWMDRVEDFGLAALVGPDAEVQIVSIHRQTVDGDGRFRGLALAAEGLAAEERSTFETFARNVGRRLAQQGYTGPFGLDAYRYRDVDGKVRFHPLGEINARMTVGLVCRALAERIGAGSGTELRVGPEPPGPNALALLRPGSQGKLGLWLRT